MEPPRRFTSRVLSHRQVSEGGYELTLERDGLDFDPGRLLTLHGDDITEDRSYSIATGTGDEYLQVLYRLIPKGILTPKLVELKEGDALDISGPYGQFTIRDPGRPMIFVATGTGVAPCRSYVRSQPDLNLTLLMGARTKDDLFYADDFSDVRYIPCLSREPDSEYPGRVTDVIETLVDTEDAHFYLCGAFEMIFDVHAILRKKGIQDDRIFTEEYYYTFAA